MRIISKAVVLALFLSCAVRTIEGVVGEVVTFQQPGPVEESVGTVEVCVDLTGVTSALSADIEVNLTVTDGSATIPGDYAPSNDPLTVTFSAGITMDTTMCASISLVNDSVLECDHDFTVEISSTSPGVTVGTLSSVTVTIQDTDDASSVVVAFQQSMYNASEGGGTTQVCVVVSGIPSGGLECDITATLTIMDGTAVLGEHFNVTDPFTVTVPMATVSNTAVCVSITILDDDVLEFEQDFTVQLSSTVPAGVMFGTLASTTVTIQDDEGPIVSDIPDQMITSGTTTTFHCNATGGNTISYSWMKDGTSLSDGTQPSGSVVTGSDTDTLSIVNVQDGDGGEYSCTASNGQGSTMSNNATLTVLVLPVIDDITDVSAIIGVDLEPAFTCDARDSYANAIVQWIEHNGEPILQDSRVFVIEVGDPRRLQLFIDDVGTADAGNYTCTATNPDGASSSWVVMLTVTGLPMLIAPLNPITEREYAQELSLNCTARNGDNVATDLTFEWLKNGDVLTADGVRVIIDNTSENANVAASSLTITSLVFSDAANYTCLVHNRQPEDGVTSTTELIVTADPPTITDSTQPEDQIDVIPGDDVMFTVVANGTDLMYQWQRNDRDLTDGGRFSGTNTSTLNITDVQEENEGMYRCIVTNIIGNDTSRVAQLTVYDPPTITDPTQPGDLINVIPGDDVMFTVVANGTDLMYQWMRNGNDLTDGGRFSGTNTPTLTIMAVQEDDEDTYQCIVSNVIGNVTSRMAQLTVLDPPVITQAPVSRNETVGTNVTFTCIATGAGNLTVMWTTTANATLPDSTETLDSDTITSTLVLTGVGAIDGGDYTCEIANEAGSVYAAATLYIIPLIVTQPMNILTEVGRSEELSCIAEGFPEPTYQWQKLDEEVSGSVLGGGLAVGNGSAVGSRNDIYIDIPGATSPMLVFTSVKFGDEGSYRCVASNVAGTTTSNSATFTVSPEGSVVVSPSNVTTEFNDTVTFMCSAQGGSGNTFQWMHDADVLTNETSDTLVIQIFSPSDGGDYTCIVRNAAGSDNATAVVYIIPRIIRQPADILTRNGEMENLTCIAESFPDPMYRWEMLEMLGSSSGRVIPSATDSLLEFSPIVFGDEGYYRCVASLVYPPEVMLPDIERESRLATLTVSPEGSVNATPTAVNTGRNNTVNFTCSALGGPGNNFTWTRLSGQEEQVATDALLTVAVQNAFDGSDYRCSVENGAGSDEDTVTLNVSPLILISPISMNVTSIQHDITLTCNASGFPVPNITWTHNDTTVNNNTSNRTTITIQGGGRSVMSSLVVTTAMTDDSGQYECIADSSIAQFAPVRSGPVVVLVQDRPEQPQNVTTVEITSCNITLVWVETHDNNAPIQGYRVMYQQPSFLGGTPEIIVTNAQRAEITGLYPGVTYNFRVVAFNYIGDSDPSDVLPVSTLEEAPSRSVQNVTAIASSSTEITVTWEQVPLDSQNGHITHYEIEYEPQMTFAGAGSMNSTVLSVVLTNLQENVFYNISVTAFTMAGPGPSSPIVVERTLEDSPDAPPMNVEAFVDSSTAITVSWGEVPEVNQNGIITMYEVQYEPLETFNGTLTVGSINTSNISSVIFNLEEDVEYNISVRAYTSVGPGPYSTDITRTTLQDKPDAPPEQVEAFTIGSIAILVSWEEVPAISQNGIIIQYEVEYNQSRFPQVTMSNTTIVDASQLMMELTGLEEDVEYSIRVRAYTSVGPGPFSPVVMNRTFEERPAEPPQNVMVSVLSSTEIRVSWEEVPAVNQNGIITQYEVQYNQSRFLQVTRSKTTIVNASQLMVELTGLEEDVEYSISVRAYTSVGPGPYSRAIANTTFEDAPSNFPQNVLAITISSTMIQVTWEEVPEIDQNGEIINYEVQCEPLETFGGRLMIETVNISNSSIMETVLMGLEEYVDYSITVRAYTDVGPGPFSPVVMNRTFENRPVDPPQNVVVSVLSSTEIRISWEEVPAISQNGIITQYEVEYNQSTFLQVTRSNTTIVNASQLMVELTGLEEDVEYSISVRAYTSMGPGPYSRAIANTTFEDAPSNFPQNVQAITISSTMIQVTWEEVLEIDQYGEITQYEVQYEPLDTFGGILMTETVNTSDGSILETVLMDLEEYVDYNITVRAYTSVGPGPYSTAIANTTFEDAPSNFPQNVQAATISSTMIQVTWEEVPEIDQNGEITQYEVQYEPLETFDGRLMIETVNTSDGSILEIVLMDLEEYVDYNITVRAYTDVGPGPFSPVVMNRTSEDILTATPVNLTVETAGPNELNVSWERSEEIDINGELRFYIIQYQIVDQANTLETTNVSGNILSTMLGGLNNFTNYTVSVAAYTIDTGPFTSEVESTAENVPGVPPQNVQGSPLSFTAISIEWISPPEEFLFGILRGYRVRYVPIEDIDNPNAYNTTELPHNTTSHILNNLMEFTNYSIEVTAVTIGDGPYSDPIIIQTNPDFVDVSRPPPVQHVDISPTSVTVRWNPPIHPNGRIIQYTVNFVAVSSTPASRQKRQADELRVECVIGKDDGVDRNISVEGNPPNTFVTLDNLTPYSTYEFRVQTETTVGAGEFSPSQTFSTPEDVPTQPRNLTVTYISSTALNIAWNEPLCDYGIRTSYTVEYEVVPGIDGDLGTPDSPHGLAEDATALVISELTPNTNYSVTVYGSTSAGPGQEAIKVGQTDEDAPPVVTELAITSINNTDLRNQVIVTVTWEPPSNCNGPFYYNITYSAEQLSPYPEGRRNSMADSVTLPGDQNQFIIDDGLPFANYTVTIYALNIKRTLPGPSNTAEHRSLALNPMAVTNLAADDTDSDSILVTWDLPLFPNGPISHYILYYIESDVVQEPPISSNGYTPVDSSTTQLEITGLVPYTNYTFHVQPYGSPSLPGDIDEEILQRTEGLPTTTALFQLKLTGDIGCSEWLTVDVDEKRDSLIATILSEVDKLCDCSLSACEIDTGSSGFQCSSDPNSIIFRAELSGALRATASDLILCIEQWISEGVAIPVLGLFFEVDPQCAVEIQSTNDPECVATGSDEQTTSDSSTGAIVAGSVTGVVFCIMLGATIAVVIVLIIIRHRKHTFELTMKGPTEKDAVIVTNRATIEMTECTAYGFHSEGQQQNQEYETMQRASPGDDDSVYEPIPV